METLVLTEYERNQAIRQGFILTPLGKLYLDAQDVLSIKVAETFPIEIRYSLRMVLDSDKMNHSDTDSNEPERSDLFEHPEFWTDELKEVLEEMEQDWDDTYEHCAKLVEKLEAIGYTCEYYLDAIPFRLRKL